MRLLFFILFLNWCTNDISCQKYISISEVIALDAIPENNSGVVKIMLPVSIPNRQTVLELHILPEAEILFDEEGVKFASWDLAKFEAGDSIKVEMTLLIEKSDLSTAEKQLDSKLDNSEKQKYLKLEKCTPKEKAKIQKKANKLKGANEVETTKNIFAFVIKHMDYHGSFNGTKGAIQALKEKVGSSKKYSELMIELCRANGIPSRIVYGRMKDLRSTLKKHYWLEVHIDAYGWVPFDPTSSEWRSEDTSVSSMRNKYIYYSNQKEYFPKGWKYTGDNFEKWDLQVKRRSEDLLRPSFNRALVYHNKGENEKAKIILDSLITITPVNYLFNMFQGVIYARLNNFDKAFGYLQSAKKSATLKGEKRSLSYAFANYYALKGEKDEAFFYLKEFMEGGRVQLDLVKEDVDLVSLRSDPRFEEILKQ